MTTRSLAAFAAALALVTTASACGGGSDGPTATASTAPTTTMERDRKQRDDELTRATADQLVGCAQAMATLMHFDVSWLTSGTPPATVAEVDPELLTATQQKCEAAKQALYADLDPTAGSGWLLMIAEQVQLILDGVNADEVNLAADTGLAMAALNIKGTIDGSLPTRPPLVIT